MTQPLLEAHRLAYTYGNGVPAVRDVSLLVPEASMTALAGANGCGKSTVIRMLAGLLEPRAGTIRLAGVPLEKWQPRLRAREIAYVPQSTAAAFPFQAIDIVLSGRTPHAPRFHIENARDVELAMEALESTGAAHLATRSWMSLSGGERQAVILARALAQAPRLLLLDEPSSALDLKHRAHLIRTLMRLRAASRLSVVMVTHDLQLTGSFDRILALRSGEVAAAGTPEEVLQTDVLRRIYDDPGVSTGRVGNQSLVWVAL